MNAPKPERSAAQAKRRAAMTREAELEYRMQEHISQGDDHERMPRIVYDTLYVLSAKSVSNSEAEL